MASIIKFTMLVVAVVCALALCRCTPPEDGGGSQHPLPIGSGMIVTSSLDDATEGNEYVGTLQASVPAGVSIQWEVDTDTLPEGLALVPSTTAVAKIMGTPVLGSGGAYKINTILIVDGVVADIQNDIALKVNAELSVSPSELLMPQPGLPYVIDLEVIGGTPTYTWEIDGAPDWLVRFDRDSHFALIASGVGVPVAEFGKSYTITVKVEDSSASHHKGGRTFTLEVGFADDSLQVADYVWPAVLDRYYSQRIYAWGGVFPYTYACSNRSPQLWLDFDATSGTIYGTPDSASFTVDDVVTFDVTVVDSSSPPMQVSKTISVFFIPNLEITTPSVLPNGREGEIYDVLLEYDTISVGYVVPGQFLWSIESGECPILFAPDGHLGQFDAGVAGGTETPYGTAGTYVFRVKLVDLLSPDREAFKDFTLTIARAALTVLSDTLASAQATVAYSETLRAGGGDGVTYRWSCSDPSKPEWLTLDAATGALTGIPDVTDIQTLPVSFTVTVESIDAGGNVRGNAASGAVSLAITSPAPLQMDTSNLLLDAVVHAPWWGVLGATGGAGDYQWSLVAAADGGVGDLPGIFTADVGNGSVTGDWTTGVITTMATGAIRGIPTATGNFSFTIRLTDRISTELTADFTLNVAASDTPGMMIGGRTDVYTVMFDEMANGIARDHIGKWMVGDGGPALAASLLRMAAFAFDSHGNLYIADARHYAIRKVAVDPTTGVLNKYCEISTICGGNTMDGGRKGVGGPAIDAQLDYIFALTIDGANNLYTCEAYSGRLLRIALNDATPMLELVYTVTSGMMPIILGIDVNNKGAGAAATKIFVSESSSGISAVSPTVVLEDFFTPPDYNWITTAVGVAPDNALYTMIIDEITASTTGGSDIPYHLYRVNTTTGEFDLIENDISHVGYPGLSLLVDSTGTVTKFVGNFESWAARDANGRLFVSEGTTAIAWR